MPGSTIIDLPCSEQEQMLFELRRTRYGYLLALHILLLCDSGFTPTQIAAALFCSRSSVYRTVKAYRVGSLNFPADAEQSHMACSLTPSLRRSLLALLDKLPAAFGGVALVGVKMLPAAIDGSEHGHHDAGERPQRLGAEVTRRLE